MARARAKKKREPSAKSESTRPPAHPRLFGVDSLEWGGPKAAKLGRKDALLGKVERLEISLEGSRIQARVRGERPQPYRVQVWVDGETVSSRCECAEGAEGPCRHAVAGLEALRFPLRKQLEGKARKTPARVSKGGGRIVRSADVDESFRVLGEQPRDLTRVERIAHARADELKTRTLGARRRSRRVRQETGPSGVPEFRVSDRSEGERTVVLRGPKGRWARCDCRDYVTNELGTCRHIERVRVWYLRKPKPKAQKLLSFWWQPRPWLEEDYRPEAEFRLHSAQELPESLKGWIDAEGWVVPPPPDWNRAAWLARLMHEARDVAEKHGLSFDLDPWVQRRLDALQRRMGPAQPHDLEQKWTSLLDDFGFELHRYQIHGARFLAKTGRAFLADDMGLGKTVQAIAATELLARTGDVRRALIVCPASLKHQWRGEIEKACGARAQVVEGRPQHRERLYEEWNSGYLIVNYELLLRDLPQLQRCAPDLIVLDEAQRIKNWGTQTARAVKRMRSRYAFVLTGTPLENRLLELHSIVEYLQPRALGPRWRLLPFHAVTAEEGRIIAYEGLSHLRDRLRPFFVRRERNQVLDQLPDRTENTFWTELTAQQKRPYRRYAVQLGQLLSSGNQLQPHQVRLLLQLLTRMRIICNSAAQQDWDAIEPRLAQPDPPSATEIKLLGSPKLEEFAHLVEELLEQGTSKMVVFSQWERTLRLAQFVLREPMQRLGLSSELFHGGLSGRARGSMIERFNQDPKFRLLLSTDAGGVGLNLQAASIVMNLEVPWNPAILQQRIARVHRMGQRNSVQVLHFVTQGAIEERVRQVVENKQSLFTGLLTEGVDAVRFSEEGRSGSLIERVRSLIEDRED